MSRAVKAPGGAKQLREMAAKKRQGGTVHELRMPWYREEDERRAAVAANEAVKRWMAADQRRIYDLGHFARLYGTAFLGFSGSLQSQSFNTRTRFTNPLAATFNGCKSVVDTISNSVAQHKPVAQFAANDGDWDAHRIAKMRARFVAGWIYEQEVYAKTAIAFRDSGVWGRGIAHVYAKNGRAVCERVFPGDLFVNQASCITNNNPLEMGRTRLIDRHEAYMMFEGDDAAQAAVLRADNVTVSVDTVLGYSDDMITLNELWRLPSYRGAGDGKHLIATTTEPLTMEEWKHPNFPFAFVDCSPKLFGYWPSGQVEDLENLQLQYNDLSYTVNEALSIGGGFKLFVDSASNVVTEALDNEIGGVIRGDGTPRSLLWQLVQPELYQRIEKLERQFYTQSGVAQMVASNEKPDPQESGIAIRERVAIYDERHALWVESYQNMHLTLAKLAIQTVQDILDDEKDETKKSYKVYSVSGPQSDPIDFADLGFEPDEQYVIQCMPVNELPDTIEGRVALAQEYVQNGWYDEATARSVFLFADVARVETMFNASHEYLSKILDAAVEKGTVPPDPESTDNLQMALSMALQHLAYAKNRSVSQGRCDLLRNYITAVKARIDEASQAMAPPPTAPLATPEAPPTSPLLPNAPAQAA